MSWLWRGDPGSLRGWTSGTTSLATRMNENSINCCTHWITQWIVLSVACQQAFFSYYNGNNWRQLTWTIYLTVCRKSTNKSKYETYSGAHFFSSILWNYFKKELFELRWKLQRSKRKGNPLMPILSRIFPQKLLKCKNIWEFLSCGGERIHHSFTKQW